ncbi:MAG: M6 family metalloprotease domain-containing protein, partial [Candidatus Eisenbacteria bacterium]
MPTRTGEVPPLVADAFHAGRFELPHIPILGTSAAAVIGTWTVPIILVDFTDQPLTYSNTSEWDRALFDTTGSTPTGSVFDYYQWVSGNRLRVIGKVVAVVHLDQTKGYYANNSWGLSSSTPLNSAGALMDALGKCEKQVNWSDFDRDLDGYVDMMWVLHSGLGGENVVTRQDLWSMTSRLSAWSGSGAYTTSDPVPGSTLMKEKIDRFSVLPEMSAFHIGSHAEIGVFCHEFGHALGLPDLYDTAPVTRSFNVGPGCWSLMSTGAYGTDNLSPEYPSHLGAWSMVYLGWRQPVRPTNDTLVTLKPIEAGGDVLELWFQGESNPEHFLIENREPIGFDRNLLQPGALVSQVDDVTMISAMASNRVNTGSYPGLRVVEADGRSDLFQGINRADRGDPMPGSSALTRWADDTTPNSRSRFGNVTNVGLRDITLVGADVRFTALVRSPGWEPARNHSGASFNPVAGTSSGARAVPVDGGGVASVSSELVAGIPQIVFRSRRVDGTWEPPLTISQSPSSAIDPTVCAIPGGDVCVAWSDARNGPNELYFRSRIRGLWTAERRLTDLPGYSRGPSLVADGFGSVHLAWQYSDGFGIHVLFMRFTYLSPFGDPVPVSGSGAVPGSPVVAMAPNGSSYIVWADQSANSSGVWFSHFSPDSGVAAPHRLVSAQNGLLPSVDATVDAAGALDLLWASSGTSGSDLHFQSRLGVTVQDTTIAHRGQPIQDFMIAIDPSGTKHVVMEAATSGSSQVLYKAWHPSGGWDIGNTEVTGTSDGVAVLPAVVPRDQTSLVVLYTGYVQNVPAFMERDRNTQAQPITAVADPGPSNRSGFLRGGPNPLRAGDRLRLVGHGATPPGALEVFDLSGRRVARAAIVADGGDWKAEIPGNETRSWPAGVYFARWSESAARL